VVVFDEATSSLDNATENSILSALETLRGRKTLIVVAHRLNTIWDFEQIVVLQGGRIQGVGTASELRATCPPFLELVKYQKEVSFSVAAGEGSAPAGVGVSGA
jgi:ABC-type multidrug transport system fused ATPase/permease subunit